MKLLVYDTDSIRREALAEVMSSRPGYRVFKAASLAEVGHLLEKKPNAIILNDHNRAIEVSDAERQLVVDYLQQNDHGHVLLITHQRTHDHDHLVRIFGSRLVIIDDRERDAFTRLLKASSQI